VARFTTDGWIVHLRLGWKSNIGTFTSIIWTSQSWEGTASMWDITSNSKMPESFPINPDVLHHQGGDKIELHPNNMNRKDGTCLSRMPLIYSEAMEETSP
jgi:hypothetical protein